MLRIRIRIQIRRIMFLGRKDVHTVLRIRIRIRWIMFLGLLDPDPDLARGMDLDPDPYIVKENSRKTLIPTVL